MKTILLTVRGLVTPQPRHQVARHSGRAYIPTKHKIHTWKTALRDAVCDQSADGPSEDLCEVSLKFYIPISKTCRKMDGSANSRCQPTSRYDIDNLSKAVLDCLQGEDCLLVDDKQVVKLTASKSWTEDEEGRCEIRIKFL